MTANEFKHENDFPHEALLDRLGLDFSDMSAEIQRDIRNFDSQYMDAIIDGEINKQEEQELITTSYKIAENIKKDHGDGTDTSGKTLGILAGIVFVFGAAIGIKQLTKL